MRLIDADKLKKDVLNLQDCYNGFSDTYDKACIIGVIDEQPSVQPERLTDDDFETIRIHLSAYKEKLCNQNRWKEAEEYQRIIDRFMAFASTHPERQVELDGTESNIEILSELRAQFNCFDEMEEPVYRALSDAICALSAQPEVMYYPQVDGITPYVVAQSESTMGQLNENGQSTKDCISRQDAIRLITHYNGVVDKSVAKRLIAQMPSVQPERKKGEWIVTSEFEDCRYVKCNQCKVTQVFYYNKPLTNFCPNCGVDMRK